MVTVEPNIYVIDPTEYENWDNNILQLRSCTLFHSSHWAKVLRDTYHYKPVYFCLRKNNTIVQCLPVMEIRSALTGNRGVSLPFTDFCDLAIAEEEPVHSDIFQALIRFGSDAAWDFIEFRTRFPTRFELEPGETYYLHSLCLAEGEYNLFSSFKSNVRRNIRKAKKCGVSVDISKTIDSVKNFFKLNCLTRRRHGLPVQPFSFFKNIHRHIICNGYGVVVSAWYDMKIIASAIFFSFGDEVIYKYGASDYRYQHLRANNLVMWDAIKWYSNKGFTSLSLGRTSATNKGLLRFKEAWGGEVRKLQYSKYLCKPNSREQSNKKSGRLVEGLIKRMPIIVLRLIGQLFYRHVG